MGAFFTPSGVGTWISDGGVPWRYAPDGTVALASPAKEVREINGEDMVLEHGITTDYAIVRAQVADRHGNLRFHGAARNFNPPCATAGRITLVEAEQVVEPGELAADDVHLPDIFVHRVYQLTPQEAAYKPMELVATTPRPLTTSTQEI